MQFTGIISPSRPDYKLDTPVLNIPIHKDLDSQTMFSKVLWKKVVPSSKRYLVENDFVFPIDLLENYRYYEIDGDRIVIDFGTSLGHGRKGKIHFGQNLVTKEFLAFKVIACNTTTIDGNNQEVVAMRNLKRLKGLICDEQDRIVYMAIELIDGVTVYEYSWLEHSNDVAHAINLAISYLNELEFVTASNVSQSDVSNVNTMVDLMRNQVFLIDFAGHSTFNHKTASFYPEPFYPFIHITDLCRVLELVPDPNDLKQRNMWTESYQQFYSSLVEIKSGERKKENNTYFDMTIEALKTKFNQFLVSI